MTCCKRQGCIMLTAGDKDFCSLGCEEAFNGANMPPYGSAREPYDDCPAKGCRHERAWQFAMLYFTDDDTTDVQAALTKRYREALQKQNGRTKVTNLEGSTIAHTHRRLKSSMMSIADQLRELADSFEEASKVEISPATTDAQLVRVAQATQHKLAWGFANLNADGVTAAIAGIIDARSAVNANE